MERLYKCYGFCGNKYPQSLLTKISNKNYCIPCAEKVLKEKNDRESLYGTIKKIFDIPYPSGFMLKQIKDYKNDRNYTYEGINQTLCYAVKVHKMKLHRNAGLAIVPYYYDKAVSYYIELEEKRKNTKMEETSNIEVIRLKPLNLSNQYIRDKVFIKMEDLV